MKKSESLVTRVTIADDGGMFLLILSVSTLMQVKLALRVSGREALIILSLTSHRACMWIHTSIVSYSDVTSQKKQNIHSSGMRMPASHQMFISVYVNKYGEWRQTGRK